MLNERTLNIVVARKVFFLYFLSFVSKKTQKMEKKHEWADKKPFAVNLKK